MNLTNEKKKLKVGKLVGLERKVTILLQDISYYLWKKSCSIQFIYQCLRFIDNIIILEIRKSLDFFISGRNEATITIANLQLRRVSPNEGV